MLISEKAYFRVVSIKWDKKDNLYQQLFQQTIKTYIQSEFLKWYEIKEEKGRNTIVVGDFTLWVSLWQTK